MDTNKIKEIRGKFIADCEEQAWRLECGAAFDKDVRVAKLAAEQKKAIDDENKLNEQFKEFDPKDYSRKTREARKALERELAPQLAEAREFKQQAEASLCTINERIYNSKIEAANYREKAEFAKTFEWKEEKPAEEKPAEKKTRKAKPKTE
jgi:hypothetical protein